jgi:HAD superfamily hydrolase (TIGR01450 family)
VTWVLDLDGVVWLADEPIAGSAAAVAQLRRRGERVVLATNNSFLEVGEYLAKLERHGIPTDRADLVTSAQAAGQLLHAGEHVLIVGGPGVREEVVARGAVEVTEAPADAVVVGWNRGFDYDLLTRAMRAVRAGARLIATNADPTYPTADGLLPGGGSLLAAVQVASGVEATIAGKPHQPIADLIAARYGPVSVMVGDRADTDGLLAKRLGASFALVLTGVTRRSDLPVDPQPDQVADSLAALVAAG